MTAARLSQKLLAVVAGAAWLSACSPAGLLNATISRAGLTVEHDIAYGPHPREKLDVYWQAGAAAAPVVVFFYGGAWNSGSKSTYAFVAATLARDGFVVVVPDYRLYPEVRFPSFLQDCAAAVAWTGAHMAQFGGDPGRLFLMGHSAGAYNAMMLGLDPRWLDGAGTSRDRLAGVVGLAGPYDFLPMTGQNEKLVFASVADGPASQPITYADARAPPLLLLAGDADETVRPRNTRALAARISALGGPVQVRIYPGVGHIGLVLAIAPIFQSKAPVLANLEAFLRAQRPRPYGAPTL